MSLTVDVVVPVYGNWALTKDCLDHLRRQSTAHRVIVVDDAGPDDTVAQITAGYPEVTLIVLERNSGFAAACNHGITAGTGDIVVLLNNDVQADATLLELLIAPFANNPELGSAAPLLFQPDGTIDAVGLCADPTVAGYVRYHGATLADLTIPEPTLLGPYGAVAAYRRRALDAVGLLDEGIFMYGEELDLALRLNAAGWHTTAVTDARGVHLGGATSGRGSARQRERAGFGRGYLLRAWGIMRGRHSLRALTTELIVCGGDLLLSRDLAATSGRLAGWRAGRNASTRPSRAPGIDRSIGLIESLQLRVGGYRRRPQR